MKIAIADDYQNCVRSLQCFATLAGHDVTVFVEPADSEAQLATRLADTEVLVVVRERISITDTLLARLPKLKMISLVGRHSKKIDFDACTRRGVLVAHGLASSPVAPAELTLAFMLAARRNVVLEATRMKAGLFPVTLSHRLAGSTLGIFGLGQIGEIVAREIGRAHV